MMMGLSGILIVTFAYSWFTYSLQIPLYWLLPFSFLSGCTGGVTLVPISCYSYIIDTTAHREQYTSRMVIYSSVSTAALILGSLLAAAIISNLSLMWLMLAAELLVIIGWLYCVIRLKQIRPAVMKQKCIDEARAKGKSSFTFFCVINTVFPKINAGSEINAGLK